MLNNNKTIKKSVLVSLLVFVVVVLSWLFILRFISRVQQGPIPKDGKCLFSDYILEAYPYLNKQLFEHDDSCVFLLSRINNAEQVDTIIYYAHGKNNYYSPKAITLCAVNDSVMLFYQDGYCRFTTHNLPLVYAGHTIPDDNLLYCDVACVFGGDSDYTITIKKKGSLLYKTEYDSGFSKTELKLRNRKRIVNVSCKDSLEVRWLSDYYYNYAVINNKKSIIDTMQWKRIRTWGTSDVFSLFVYNDTIFVSGVEHYNHSGRSTTITLDYLVYGGRYSLYDGSRSINLLDTNSGPYNSMLIEFEAKDGWLSKDKVCFKDLFFPIPPSSLLNNYTK